MDSRTLKSPDPLAALAALAGREIEGKRAQAESNRRRMPATAATLDLIKGVFGEHVKVSRAIEEGPEGRVVVGKWEAGEVERWKPADLQSPPDPPAAAKHGAARRQVPDAVRRRR